MGLKQLLVSSEQNIRNRFYKRTEWKNEFADLDDKQAGSGGNGGLGWVGGTKHFLFNMFVGPRYPIPTFCRVEPQPISLSSRARSELKLCGML